MNTGGMKSGGIPSTGQMLVDQTPVYDKRHRRKRVRAIVKKRKKIRWI